MRIAGRLRPLGLLLALGWGAAQVTAAPVPAGRGALPAFERAAAIRILALTVLPPGAVPVHGAAAPGLGQPFERPATPALVDVHGLWVAPLPVARVAALLQRRRPRGGTPSGTGTLFGPGGLAVTADMWTFAPGGVRIGSAGLIEAVAAVGPARTELRADAQVIGRPARPPAEDVPGGVTAVRVTVGWTARTARHGVVRRAAAVRALARLLDGLPTLVPAAAGCLLDAVPVTLDFARSATGPVLLTAHEIYGCAGSGVQVTRGRLPLPSLADLRGRLALAALRDAGLPLSGPPGGGAGLAPG